MNFTSKTLFKAFFGVSALFMVGMPLNMIANVVLARSLSLEDFGVFSFTVAVATVLAIPVSGGLPMLLTREAANYSQSGNWEGYKGIVAGAHRWIAGGTVLVGLGLVIWVLVTDTRLSPATFIPFLLVPFLGLSGVSNGILKGLGRPVLAETPYQVVQPILLVTGYIVMWYIGVLTATNALWWYLAVVIAVFAVMALLLVRVRPDAVQDARPDYFDLPRWRKAILPFVMLSAATTLNAQISILILGFAGQEEAVAQMRVAERGALLVAFPLAFINTIIGPYFVQALREGEPAGLRRITRSSARLTLLVSLPVAIVLGVFGRPLLSLTFGPPYDVQAYVPMMILIVGQIVSVALGNGGMLLAMGGYERHTNYSMALSLIATTSIGFLLISVYGAIGAAIGAAGGMIIAKVYVYVFAKRKFSVSSAAW